MSHLDDSIQRRWQIPRGYDRNIASKMFETVKNFSKNANIKAQLFVKLCKFIFFFFISLKGFLFWNVTLCGLIVLTISSIEHSLRKVISSKNYAYFIVFFFFLFKRKSSHVIFLLYVSYFWKQTFHVERLLAFLLIF